jgi:hypothetical protein
MISPERDLRHMPDVRRETEGSKDDLTRRRKGEEGSECRRVASVAWLRNVEFDGQTSFKIECNYQYIDASHASV